MQQHFQFRLGTFFWIVVLCSSFAAGFANGRSYETRKLEEAEREQRMLDERERELAHLCGFL